MFGLHLATARLGMLKGRKRIGYRCFVRSTPTLEGIVLQPFRAVRLFIYTWG
jgi:hypothetical protein